MDREVAKTIEGIKAFIKKGEPLLMKSIEDIMPKDSDVENLYEPMWYHLGTVGKRLRPGLCMLVAERLGVELEKILPFAAGLELIHGFSLVHDDLQDQDTLRRGKPSVWVKYGTPHAINIGDGMLVKAFESVLNSDLPEEVVNRLMRLVSKTCITIVEGQAMDINFRDRPDVTEEEYMEMVWRKTGALFGSALSGAALVARAEKGVQDALMEYGKLIGPAFQIRDDVIDLDPGAHKGRELGADIKEGKRSLMVITALQSISKKRGEQLLDILDKPKEKTTEQETGLVINILNSCGAVDYAKKKAEYLVRKSQNSLEVMENIELKKELWALAEYIITRKN